MAVARWFEAVLDHYGVPFEAHHHPPVFSASHLAHVEHVSGYRVAKMVFLAAQGRPLAVVLPACDRLDLGRVRAVVGAKDLRLATEAEIAGWFKGCQPGAVPPLRLRSDMGILMDRSLACLGKILFPAGSGEEAVVVRFRDWYRAVRPGVGRFTAGTKDQADGHQPATVLVVEDESETNQLFCRLLERHGLACRGAGEGNEALALASEVRPSAILLDLMLPDMSGFDVYERLRRTGPLKHVPLIVVTALNDEASRQRCWQMGADAFLSKPFPPEELVSELTGALADAHA
jgi:Ala-tRNA(Pro) deacylase